MGKDTKKKHQTPQQQHLLQPKTPSVSKFFERVEDGEPTHSRDKMAETPEQSISPTPSPSSSPSHSLQPDLRELISLLPTKADLQAMALTIREAQKAELADIKNTLQEIGGKLGEMEGQMTANTQAIKRNTERLNAHHKTIYLLKRQMEDLDNRGRRNNIRIRGLPEAIKPTEIEGALQKIFNSILGRPQESTIDFDRAHRALSASQQSEQPRDVICCLHSHRLKESIMQKTRAAGQIHFADKKIEVYQDLAWLTLQQRRLLRPLTKAMQEKGIKYRWGYPFALMAQIEGRTHTLKEPDDLHQFCTTMGLQAIKLEEWRQLMYGGEDLMVPQPQEWESPSKRRRPADRPA